MSMRIAVGSRYLTDWPAGDIVALAGRLGADGVEFSQSHLLTATEFPDDPAADLAGACAAGRLTLVGADLSMPAASREGNMAETVSALCEQVVAAARVGLPVVCLSAGKRASWSMEALVRCTRRVAEIAAAPGVQIEVTNRLGTRLEQIEDLRQFIVLLRPSGLRLRIDTGEFHAAAVNPRDVLAEFGDVAGSVVISDRKGRKEVPPGSGQVNLAGVMGDLVRAGYDGWLIVNVRSHEKVGPGHPVEAVRRLVAGGAPTQTGGGV